MNLLGVLLGGVVVVGISLLTIAVAADTFVLVRAGRALSDAARRHSTVDDEAAMASPLTPALTLVVPWCGADPIERLAMVRSLRYPDLQIVVVSTGSAETDALRREFGLVEVPMVLPADLPSRIKVTRSLVPQDATSLTVVETTGPTEEADLLNIGVGLARARGVVVLHRGMMLADDSLLRLARPFRDRPRPTYATSAVARPLDGGIVDHERVVGRRWPSTWAGRFDVVRRLRRAVLPHAAGLGHQALVRPGGLLLIRRDQIEAVGGYRPEGTGTDADLLARVERMQLATRGAARVIAPMAAPICWRPPLDGGSAPAGPRIGTSAPWFVPVLAVAVVVAVAGLLTGEIGPGLVVLLAVVGVLAPATVSLAELTADEIAFPREGSVGDLGATIVAAVVEPFRFPRR